jgi:hypothetical protein
MAVMSRGGIDTDVQNRMMRLRNDPNALGQQAQKTGDILDLIAARRAADLVAEQKKLAALQMNGSPATVKDQLEKELVDGQKEMMAPDLNKLREKTQGVSGVLQNQNRQRIAQQQRPTMRAAMGGIINAPAPNLNRMYNGGIVGYAEGGLTGDEIAAYLKRAGIKQEDYDNATLEERARVIEGINKLIAKDRKEGTRRSSPKVSPFGDSISPAASEDVTRQATESFYDLFRSDPTGEELMKGREEFNPTERQDAAERLMNLPDVRGGMELDIGTREQPTPLKDDIYGRLPTMMPKGAMDNLEAYEGGLGNKTPQQTMMPKGAMDNLGAYEEVGISPAPELTALQRASEALDPEALNRVEKVEPKTGIASVVKSEVPSTFRPISGYNQPATVGEKPKPTAEELTPLQKIQEKLDAMDGKKGIAGLVERFANTNFKKSYGDNFGALAQAGRDIVETGQKEKAQRRKFLEEQLGVQQAIEAAQVKEAAEESRFTRNLAEVARQANQTNQRLEAKDYNVNQNQIAAQAATNAKSFFDSQATLKELGLKKQQLDQLAEHQKATTELQAAANQYKQDAIVGNLHRVVQGYIQSSNRLYAGLLGNADRNDIPIIMQQQQAERARLAQMIGADGTSIDLSAIQNPPADTAPDTSGITVTPRAS